MQLCSMHAVLTKSKANTRPMEYESGVGGLDEVAAPAWVILQPFPQSFSGALVARIENFPRARGSARSTKGLTATGGVFPSMYGSGLF